MFSEILCKRVQKDFTQKYDEVLKEKITVIVNQEESVSFFLKYLYAYMPVSDAGNYDTDCFLDYARRGEYLWKHSPYCEKIREYLGKEEAEELFLNYVLYHRINEEEIKPCRSLFGEVLEERVQGLSMKEAILEINYWCAENMTYQSTDERTSSAYDVWRCGFGRCGEESVLAVNALRSVGIPARQVYAPRWAHCNDNHAWVEVWCEGEWHYIGACEPEEVMDRGWFNNAASRAMMVYSRRFDLPVGEENYRNGLKSVGTEGMNVLENQLQRYARTTEVEFCVTDPEGKTVSDALIRVEILNYSEFAPIAWLHTDSMGKAYLRTGFGSFHVTVSAPAKTDSERWYAFYLVDTRKEQKIVLQIGEQVQTDNAFSFDVIAPEDTAGTAKKLPAELEQQKKLKTAKADTVRNKKIAQFIPDWQQVFNPDEQEEIKPILNCLTTKDQRDVRPEVIKECLDELRTDKIDKWKEAENIYFQYVLNPRISFEILTCWRQFIAECFTEQEKNVFRDSPKEIWNWISDHMIENKDKERSSIYTTPVAALKTGYADQKSQAVLFVAIARTLGLPARLNPIDGKPEYMPVFLQSDGCGWMICKKEFQNVWEEDPEKAELILMSEQGVDWKYTQNWTIARLNKEGYDTLNLQEMIWENNCIRMLLSPGCYRILTTNRLPSGNSFVNCYDLVLKKQEKREQVIKLREADLLDMLNCHKIPDQELRSVDEFCDEKYKTSVGEVTDATEKKLLLWLQPGKEPTEHILNELMEMEERYRPLKKQIVFLIESPADCENPTLKKCLEIFKESQIWYTDYGIETEMTARLMYVDPGKMPLLVVTDGKCNGIYAASGYFVGAADLIFRIMNTDEALRLEE